MRNEMISTVFVTLLFVGEILTAPSETINSPLPNSSDRYSNIDDQDSYLERVHVKQETGFDGKVRSIRFNLEPEKNEKIIGTRKEVGTSDSLKSKTADADFGGPASAFTQSSLESGDSSSPAILATTSSIRKLRMVHAHDSSKKLLSINVDQPIQMPSTNTRLSRSRRTVDKKSAVSELDDLKAEEAKVFRPLFVYRQQVAKRLKTPSRKISNNGRRSIQNNNYGYYSNRPRPYHYYHYPYHYNQPYDVGFYQYL